jgi:hypothetical protein
MGTHQIVRFYTGAATILVIADNLHNHEVVET